jgi:translation elongation factor EF-1alpha
VSAQEFNELPLMIPRAKVLKITGWSKSTFTKRVKCGHLKPVMTLPGGKQLFRKLDFSGLV